MKKLLPLLLVGFLYADNEVYVDFFWLYVNKLCSHKSTVQCFSSIKKNKLLTATVDTLIILQV